MEVICGYLAVDEDGYETIFRTMPTRGESLIDTEGDTYYIGEWQEVYPGWCHLPDGMIEKMIGKKLTWENDPFPIIEYL